MATMKEQQSIDETSLWPLTTRSALAFTMEAADKKESTTGSPESLPSLASLSQTSTDGDDHPHLEYEIPGVLKNTMLSEEDMAATSWPSPDTSGLPAILDNDDCSSGILSAEALDLSEASVHSFASMATFKSPTGRLSSAGSVASDPVLEPVDAEDIKIYRTCHGALNIDPKQLANVFALFKNEPETPQANHEQRSTDPPGIRTIELTGIAPVAVRSSTVTIDEPVVSNAHPWTGYASNQKLTAEMYWKPRAETLEKECATLKEIIRADSSKIFQLKRALAAQSTAIESFKDQLGSAKQDREILQKEKDVFAETETEHCETIRILKEEVDRLTRDDTCIPSGSVTTAADPSLIKEVEQLRLENQLFASQIIEYEAELENLTQAIESTANEKVHQPSDQQGFGLDLGTGVAEPSVTLSSSNSTAQQETNMESTKPDQKNDTIDHSEDYSAAGVCLDQLPMEVPIGAPQHIFGAVLGMFTVGGNSNVHNTERDDVFVVQEPAQNSQAIDNEVDPMQGRTPNVDPVYVEVQRLDASQQTENNDPPATEMDETAIEVLENHDASLEIEVQLSPYPIRNKEEESQAKPNSHSGMCDENCGAWHIFRFFSSDPHM